MYRSRVGSVVLSWDFLLGCLVGVPAALLPALSESVDGTITGILTAMSAIGAGVATLVLTAMTVLVGALGKSYRSMLSSMPTGLRGAFRPYVYVISVAIGASLTALIACLAWPLITVFDWRLVWLLAAIPFVLMAWSLFGCLQIIMQLIQHMEDNSQIEELEERRRRAIARKSN